MNFNNYTQEVVCNILLWWAEMYLVIPWILSNTKYAKSLNKNITYFKTHLSPIIFYSGLSGLFLDWFAILINHKHPFLGVVINHHQITVGDTPLTYPVVLTLILMNGMLIYLIGLSIISICRQNKE